MAVVSHHVVPREGERWAVRRSGDSRASSIHSTQREAIQVARKKAREEGTDLYIHHRDGQIKSCTFYSKVG